MSVLSVVLQDPRETKEENIDWRSVGRLRRPMKKRPTWTDFINVLWKCFWLLLLCKTLVWETTQRAVLINKFQHFDIWSLPSIFDHAGRFEVQQLAHYRELTLQSIKVNLFCIAVQLNPKRIHCMEDDYLKADIICWNKACNWPSRELFRGCW